MGPPQVMELDPLLSTETARGLVLVLGGTAARVGGAVWTLPLAGGRWVPVAVRLALVAALALALAPHLWIGAAEAGALTTPYLLALLAKEALVGLALGFIMGVVFWGVESAARLMNVSLGSTGSGQAETWPLALFLPLLAALLFLLLGGHRLYILALARSFEIIPLWVIPEADGLGGLVSLCLSLGGELFLLAFLLAAPLVGSLLLADLGLAWISRPPATARTLVLLQPARALLGVGLLLVTVALLAQVIPLLLEEALGQVELATDRLAH